MKKLLSLMLVLLIVSSVFASYLDETKTMDTTLFGNLYDAIDYDNGHDEVMRFYWDKLVQYASPNPTSRYKGEDDWREGKASYEPINYASTYAANSLIGALAVEKTDTEAEAFLNGAKDYLIYNPYNDEHYLSLDSLWVEFDDPGSYSPALGLGTLMLNTSFIVDMLWYYVTPEEQDSLYNILNEVAYFAYLVLEDHEPKSWVTLPDNVPEYYPDNFAICNNNYRLHFTAVLGYAGCINI